MKGEFSTLDVSLKAIEDAKYTSTVNEISIAISKSADISLSDQATLQEACSKHARTLSHGSGRETDLNLWAEISNRHTDAISSVQSNFRATYKSKPAEDGLQQIAL